MKNIKKKIAGTGVALLASLTMVTGAFASDTEKQNDVDVIIKSGEFSLATPEINSFGEIELKSTPQTHKTSFADKFTVKDLRGSQAGWRVDVSASQFTDGENVLPKGTLSLDPVSSITRVGAGQGALPVKTMVANTVIDDGTVAVLKANAGSGMGVFDFAFDEDALSIVIDPTTAKVSGDTTVYESTLTWNLVQAP